MKKLIWTTPLFFVASAILLLYANNQEQLGLVNVVLPLTISLASVLVTVLILRLIIKGWEKSALITTLIVWFFFAYGQVYAPLESVVINGFVVGRVRYFVPVYALFFLLFAWLLFRTKKDLQIN